VKDYSSVRTVLIVTLLANAAVAVLKIAVGKSTGSTSMVADGMHSLADGASNVVGLVAVSLAARPADADHPYGHRKYETLAAVGVAALLFFACYNLVVDVVTRFGRPHLVEASWASFSVMALTLAANLGVCRYEYRAGKRLGSDLLVADACHTASDVFASASVIASLVAVRLGYPILDLVASLLIAALIARAGGQIVRQASWVLCDRAVIEPAEVEETVRSVRGVKSCHAVRSRGREDEVLLDMHLEVEDGMTLQEAHALSHEVMARLKERFPGLSDVLVHVEPLASSRQRQPYKPNQ
jgi:cation diffusion facilitator family transporter